MVNVIRKSVDNDAVVAWVYYSNDDVYLESFVNKHVNKHVKSLNMRCLINETCTYVSLD